MIMSTFNLKQLFKKFEGHCNVFEKKRNVFLFAEYIVKYMEYYISHYSLVDAIISFLRFLNNEHVIKYNILDHSYISYDNNIDHLDDSKIMKYENNILYMINCNAMICNDLSIILYKKKNIPEVDVQQNMNDNVQQNVKDSEDKTLEQNVENNIGGGSKEESKVINVFNGYHMLNSYKTKFITYYPLDQIAKLKFYQSNEFWRKFIDYISEYSSNIIYDVFPLKFNEFEFKSTNSGEKYTITVTETGFKCTCPDHVHRNHDCKHIKDFIKLVEIFMSE